ncbi:MAG: universal stress protein [Desulfatiglandales bacterium]
MIKKILVATDGSGHAKKAIEFATDIALQYDATICILHVVSKIEIPEEFLRYVEVEGFEETPQSVYLQKIGDEIIGAAEKAISKKSVREVQTALVQGDPAEKILEFARDQGVDMIVLGSRGLGRIKELLLGSVSSKVCHLAECTCVTVK